MLLQKLVEYSERLESMAPSGYSKKNIRYLIELDINGNLRNPMPVDLSDEKNKRGAPHIVPNVVRANAIKPLLLSDNAEYTFNLPRDEKKAKRTAESYAAYMALVTECVKHSESEHVLAVLKFLERNPLEELTFSDEYERDGAIIFRVDGQFPTEQKSVQKFWAEKNAPQGETMQCLICGEFRPTLKRLKGKIKGIPNGQTSGTSLISANAKAFESYGLEASQTSPVCENCADGFTKALNHLLGNRSTRIMLNGLVFTFWTRNAVEFDFMEHMDEPKQEKVYELLNSLRTGKVQPGVDEVSFYAVSLSASGARAVVRDWVETTVGSVKQTLAVWFVRQQIVDAWGEQQAPLSIYRLASATVREMKDLPTQTPQTLIRSALSGTPLPMSLLQQALRRNAAEHTVTYQRAALIKLVLASRSIIQEDEMVELQTDRSEPAYHCGRLLAVLEQIQKSALGNVNSSIVDRFYGTASTAPASVFGTLLGGAQPHLSKLRRGQREGTAFALQSRLEEVLSMLPDFPRTLKLQEQALFALGYYHQRAYDRAQAKAASEAKKTKSKTTDAGGA